MNESVSSPADDLRITDGHQNINVVFDLVVPYEYDKEKISSTTLEIRTKLKEINTKYNAVIQIDYA